MQTSQKFTRTLLACLLLGSCAADKKLSVKDVIPPPGVGPIVRSSAGDGKPVAPGGKPQALPLNITPPEEIAWTGFDGEEIPELANLIAAPKKGPWEESETIARQTAAREGKPILIWFTDSARSPMCKILSSELFSKPDFEKWAAKNLVRLRVDANTTVTDPKLSLDEKTSRVFELKAYVKRMKKRYRVLGQPSVLMLNPSGEVIAPLRGYKRGDADFFWGLIKQNTIAAKAANKEWRAGLEAKGYREWRGESGRKIFAKLISYSNGSLILIEPGGERFRTHEDKLSKGDRKWITDQKTMRGIE
jgi:thioredoxin-related protein